jgi:ubiquinone/menaquinone biosynthesis C-methylase UbiE
MFKIFILEQTIFTNAALDYDKLTDFASLGMHRIWRRIFIDRLGPTNNTKLIDMAAGTGNRDFQIFIALIHFLKVLQQFGSSNISKTTT